MAHFIGIDLGTASAVASVWPSGEPGPSLVHNEASEVQTTPCVHVSASNGRRAVGASATQLLPTRPAETVRSATLAAFTTQPGGASGAASLKSPDGGATLGSDSVLAMVMGKLVDAALAKLPVEAADSAFPDAVRVCVAVPEWASLDGASAVHRALTILGVPPAARLVVPSWQALCAAHAFKHGGEAAGAATVLVDVGAGGAVVAAVQARAQDAADGPGLVYDALHVAAVEGVGGTAVDDLLVAHISDAIRSKHGVDVAANAKLAHRVRRAAERCKKTLSTIAQARAEVENVGNDADATVTIDRASLDTMCGPMAGTIRDAVATAVAAAVSAASAGAGCVEVVGGGARVPIILGGIRTAAAGAAGAGSGDGASYDVRFTLDSNSAVAVGAACLAAPEGAVCSFGAGEGAAPADAPSSAWPSAAEADAAAAVPVEELKALEARFRAIDAEERRLHGARNDLESLILQTRSARSGQHGSLIPDTVAPVVDAAEEWLYDAPEDTTTADDYEAKRAELDAKVRELASEYFDKVEEERVRLEEELRKEAEEAPKEDKDDHDFRKLKFPDRMRLVMLNKDEGATLFKDGNITHAAGRFVKALTHADKFVGDLTDDQKAEISKVKLALHLNAAQCFLKLEMLPKAIGNLDDALRIDPKCVKALYRRAVAFEAQQKIDDAEKDINAALEIAPEDAAVLQFKKRIDALRKRHLARQKKMAAKMFGGSG